MAETSQINTKRGVNLAYVDKNLKIVQIQTSMIRNRIK